MYMFIHLYIYIYIHVYPLSVEALEPLARFVRKLPKDSYCADEGCPDFKDQEFSGSFNTNHFIGSAQRAKQAGIFLRIFIHHLVGYEDFVGRNFGPKLEPTHF